MSSKAHRRARARARAEAEAREKAQLDAKYHDDGEVCTDMPSPLPAAHGALGGTGAPAFPWFSVCALPSLALLLGLIALLTERAHRRRGRP